MPTSTSDPRTWDPQTGRPYDEPNYTAGLSPSAYQNAIGTAIGETYPNQRNVTDFAPIFDTMATRAENPSMYVPPGYRDANDPLNSVITAPMFSNNNLPQYNTQSPAFPQAYQQYRAGFAGAAPQNFNESGYYTGDIPGMQNAAIAAYGVFGGGVSTSDPRTWDPQTGMPYGGFGGGSLRGIGLDADSYANSANLAQRQGQLNQGEFPIAFGAGDRAHYFNANPDYSQYSYPGAEDTTGGVIDATTGYFRQYTPQPGPVSTSDPRTWDPQTGMPYGGFIGATQPAPPMQDYSTGGGGGYGSYNPAGQIPSFAGGGDSGNYSGGYGPSSYAPTQFSGDPAAGYYNPSFRDYYADPEYSALTPAQYNTLNFTVGGPTSTSDPRTWDPQTGMPYGGYGAAPPAAAPSASTINGYQDYAAGVTPTAGYSIQPGTAAATYGDGMTAQDAAAQAQTYNDLQSRLANEASFYSAQQAALPSSPQNYYSQIVQPYEQNFSGQIQGYNPFSTQYQSY
jgi:hypothetical protein